MHGGAQRGPASRVFEQRCAAALRPCRHNQPPPKGQQFGDGGGMALGVLAQLELGQVEAEGLPRGGARSRRRRRATRAPLWLARLAATRSRSARRPSWLA